MADGSVCNCVYMRVRVPAVAAWGGESVGEMDLDVQCALGNKLGDTGAKTLSPALPVPLKHVAQFAWGFGQTRIKCLGSLTAQLVGCSTQHIHIPLTALEFKHSTHYHQHMLLHTNIIILVSEH